MTKSPMASVNRKIINFFKRVAINYLTREANKNRIGKVTKKSITNIGNLNTTKLFRCSFYLLQCLSQIQEV